MLATRLEDPRRLGDPRCIAEVWPLARAQVDLRGGRTSESGRRTASVRAGAAGERCHLGQRIAEWLGTLPPPTGGTPDARRGL